MAPHTGIPDSEDILSGLSGDGVRKAAEIASFVFPPAALISGIPIFSIVIRYNLVVRRIRCRPSIYFLPVRYTLYTCDVPYRGGFILTLS